MTALYTGVTDKGELKGIFVDRGWLPEDFSKLKAHWQGQTNLEQVIEGVIVYGEGKSHTGKGNDEVNKIRIDLEDIIGKA